MSMKLTYTFKNGRLQHMVLTLFSLTVMVSLARAEEKISYNEKIRPIFNKSCVGCHGGVKKTAGVSFIYREEALGISDNGKRVIIPGDPENSEVVKRISSKDQRYVMPPLLRSPPSVRWRCSPRLPTLCPTEPVHTNASSYIGRVFVIGRGPARVLPAAGPRGPKSVESAMRDEHGRTRC